MAKAQDLGGMTQEEFEAIWGKEGEGVETQEAEQEEKVEDIVEEEPVEPALQNEPDYDKLLSEHNELTTKYEALSQKYKSYDGTFTKITNENNALKSKIAQLEIEIGKLSTHTETPIRKENSKRPKIHQKWAELYGEETADEMLAEIQEVTETAVEAKIAPIRKGTEEDREERAQRAQYEFDANLRASIPDFDNINNSTDFIVWLEENPYDKKIGIEAITSKDVKAVSKLIERFKKDTGITPPVATPQKPAHIAPKATGGSYVPPQKQEINLTSRQIKDWWAAYRMGKPTGYTDKQDALIFDKYKEYA